MQSGSTTEASLAAILQTVTDMGGHPEPWHMGPHPEPWRPLATILLTGLALREAARSVEGADGTLSRVAQRMIDDCGSIGPRRPHIPVPIGGDDDRPRPNWGRAALATEVVALAQTLPNPRLQRAALEAARDLLSESRFG
ncbi:hypothetical protein ACE7GA_05160 [Roseomonas sp. CCTCC AB2023176]|uniref:hypothetical protein n=1 Tax=Roseomonas sp. CCTCC AB2023176 TaxID=3342640 RepID=UPI0035DC825B